MTEKATTKQKPTTAEKPVISINVDLYKKEISKDVISVRVNAQLTGNKKEIRTFLFGAASIFNPDFNPGRPFFESPIEEPLFPTENK